VKEVKNIHIETGDMSMTKRISTLAIMICLTASLALAQDTTKTAQPSDDSAAIAKNVASNYTGKDSNGNCPPDKTNKKEKKAKQNAKPTTQQQKEEEEFDRVLRGIYG
jgi:hypothetical protein